MKFIPSRDFRIRPGEVWKELKEHRELVVTSHGQPVALMVPVTGEDFEEKLRSFHAMELGRLVRKIQQDSVRKGTDKMTMEEIDEIIQEVRREHRQKAGQ